MGALRARGLAASGAAVAAFRGINEVLWEAYRQGRISQARLKRERFRRLLRVLGRDGGDATALDRDFLRRLSKRGDRLPFCRETLRRLRPHYRLAVVTNGIDPVQRARIRAAGLAPFFEAVFTSEAVGYAKPDPRILHAALDAMELRPEAALYVGDDPRVDGDAARRAGVTFLWVRGRDAFPAGATRPRHVAATLREAADLLTRGRAIL